MSDAFSIIEKIRNEIESYSGYKAKNMKLIFENTTPELLSNLQQFLDSALSDPSLSDLNIEEFISKLYSTLGWKRYDN
ncbi:MAG: hypothetical protein ACTSQE_13525 [Candidatus Heimdallarchaeaceae archaeon]